MRGSGNPARPNVVVILVDDMGYGDIAAHGDPAVRTPQLDRLHAESVRLTDFQVDPTCSATRTALMTGKYSHRDKVWREVRSGTPRIEDFNTRGLVSGTLCPVTGQPAAKFGVSCETLKFHELWDNLPGQH